MPDTCQLFSYRMLLLPGNLYKCPTPVSCFLTSCSFSLAISTSARHLSAVSLPHAPSPWQSLQVPDTCQLQKWRPWDLSSCIFQYHNLQIKRIRNNFLIFKRISTHFRIKIRLVWHFFFFLNAYQLNLPYQIWVWFVFVYQKSLKPAFKIIFLTRK